MHIHILGICGTFMGGLAVLAKEAGHKVTGSDKNIYPPMSDKLREAGIDIIEGYCGSQLDIKPDLIVVGNVMKRGMDVVERMLNENFAYVSGPQWLSEHYLKNKNVIAVAGTHGKTTTSSMIAHILEYSGLNPGFLIGGVPGNFPFSARNTQSPYFVIEADEYDCAFFDKRSKFVHYHPNIALLNNLEFDHADIFDNINDIKKQFHYLVRTIKGSGSIVFNAEDNNLLDVINMGAWSELIPALSQDSYNINYVSEDFSSFSIYHQDRFICRVEYSLSGIYNAKNTLMAMICASKAGINFEKSAEAMRSFVLPKRRMELKAEIRGVQIYDDFAHHPTAIKLTLEGLRAKLKPEDKLIAVFEPRSNSMKQGAHKELLPYCFDSADMVYLYASDAVHWNAHDLCRKNCKIKVCENFEDMLFDIVRNTDSNTKILTMSNGSFNGICTKLANLIRQNKNQY